VTIKNLRTGRYLALDASDNVITQSSPYTWNLSKQFGFLRFNSTGTWVEDTDTTLAVTDRISFENAVGMATVNTSTDLSSPYSGYEGQHWHVLSHKEGTFSFQNRWCGRVLVDANGAGLKDPVNSFDERWRVAVQ